jgi:acetolactate synthase I/II/III large subunit
MRVCDWIAEYLYSHGVERVHGLMGGGASGLNDGFIKNGKIKYICYHHEQGAGHAAIGESKATGKISIVNPTTGCGGTNTATSVLDAYQDSVPVIFISGNVKLDTTTNYLNRKHNINLRKYGVQEHDIIGTMKSMCKTTYFVETPEQVAFAISNGIKVATSGRPGPVWIDIPANVQTAPMPEKYSIDDLTHRLEQILDLSAVKEAWAKAKRPLVVAGYGIRHSDTIKDFIKFIHKHGVPYVSTYGARDYTPYEDTFNIGTIGLRGSRAGNFAMQNADLLLILGASMNSSHVGYDPAQFAPTAYKIQIDIDDSELRKDTVPIDLQIRGDLRDFFKQETLNTDDHADWRLKTLHWKNKWPVFQESYKDDSTGLNLYAVLEQINIDSDHSDVLMADAGSSSYACPVAWKAKFGQDFIITPAQADMGWALPAAIGVALARPDSKVISVTGDGSFMCNLQELAVVKHHDLNIKYIILNNRGYLSIKNTQSKYFEGRVYGTDDTTGLWFPDLLDVANTFGLNYAKFETYKNLQENFRHALNMPGPTIIDCRCMPWQDILPSQALKEVNGKKIQAGLHDLAPFLSDEELAEEMIVDIK